MTSLAGGCAQGRSAPSDVTADDKETLIKTKLKTLNPQVSAPLLSTMAHCRTTWTGHVTCQSSGTYGRRLGKRRGVRASRLHTCVDHCYSKFKKKGKTDDRRNEAS